MHCSAKGISPVKKISKFFHCGFSARDRYASKQRYDVKPYQKVFQIHLDVFDFVDTEIPNVGDI